jgi:hypothetical protein
MAEEVDTLETLEATYNQSILDLAKAKANLKTSRDQKDSVYALFEKAGKNWQSLEKLPPSIKYVQEIEGHRLDWWKTATITLTAQVNAADANVAKRLANYKQALKDKGDAYDDWLEFKEANMTPEETSEFLIAEEEAYAEIESKSQILNLKVNVWKYLGIGLGAILFLFLFFWIMKKFRVRIPTVV